MALFDLVFIFLFLASVATLITAALVALRGRRAHALGIVGKLAVAAIGYFLIVSVVGLLAPQRVLRMGDPWCFDDWCLSVESVARIPAPPAVRVSRTAPCQARATVSGPLQKAALQSAPPASARNC